MFQVTLKNGNQKSRCAGRKISVQIYGGKNDSVNCQVDTIYRVEAGQQVVWNSNERNLGSCSKDLFDVSVGNEPKFQVKTYVSDPYCPESVELKINDMYFCGKTHKSGHRRGYFYGIANNFKRHDTIKGRCP